MTVVIRQVQSLVYKMRLHVVQSEELNGPRVHSVQPKIERGPAVAKSVEGGVFRQVAEHVFHQGLVAEILQVRVDLRQRRRRLDARQLWWRATLCWQIWKTSHISLKKLHSHFRIRIKECSLS